MLTEKLFEKNSIYAAVIDELPDMVRVLDKSGHVKYANKAFTEKFGDGLNDICRKIPGATNDCRVCTAVESIRTSSRQTTVLNVRGRVYSVSANPVTYDGEVYAIETISDITLEHNLKDKLLSANERMVNDLELAGNLQLSILRNELPCIEGYDFCAKFLPCTELGGDMYDCFLMRDGRIFMYIADVSGHGVMPAMLTIYLRQEMFAQCKNPGISPKQVLANLQDSFEELSVNPSIYITVFAIVLEPETGTILYCNAGHSVTPLIASETSIRELYLPGTPICRWTNSSERSEQIDTLNKNERLLLFTDGFDDIHVDPVVLNNLNDMLINNNLKGSALLDAITIKFAKRKEDDVTMLLCERK